MAIPTVSDKIILVDFSLTETNAFSLQPIDTQRQFSSTDKGTAFIGFKSENIANGMTADVSLANLDDDSRVNRTFTVTTGTNFDATNKIFYYQIPDDEIVHWGNWIGYGKFTDGATSKTWTGTKLKYSISRDITNDPTTKLIVMEDVNAFMDAMNILKADLESYRTTVIQQEADRVTAENDRVTKEGQRVTAESGRVTAESGRTTAESGRVTAENTRATNYATYDAKFTTLDARTEFDATNLVDNGDFSNGTTGWSAKNGTISATNKVLTLTGNGDTNTIQVRPEIIYSHKLNLNSKIYAKTRIRVTNAGASAFWLQLVDTGDLWLGNFKVISNPSQNQYYEISGILTASSIGNGNGRVLVAHQYADATTATGKTAEVQYISFIDLTATFGAGKEPTLAEMDRLMVRYPNSWFDGTKPIQTIETLYQEKANKVQEAWITPTLSNGWVDYDSTTRIRYRKDGFGRVHLDGIGKNGASGQALFVLPIGYRPLNSKIYKSYSVAGGDSITQVATTGHITHWSGSLSGHSVIGIVIDTD